MAIYYIKRQVREYCKVEYILSDSRYGYSASMNIKTKRFTVGSYADKFFSTLFFGSIKKNQYYNASEIDREGRDYAMKIFKVGRVQDAKNWRFWAAMYEHLLVARNNILVHIDAHNISVNLKLWRK